MGLHYVNSIDFVVVCIRVNHGQKIAFQVNGSNLKPNYFNYSLKLSHSTLLIYPRETYQAYVHTYCTICPDRCGCYYLLFSACMCITSHLMEVLPNPLPPECPYGKLPVTTTAGIHICICIIIYFMRTRSQVKSKVRFHQFACVFGIPSSHQDGQQPLWPHQ